MVTPLSFSLSTHLPVMLALYTSAMAPWSRPAFLISSTSCRQIAVLDSALHPSL